MNDNVEEVCEDVNTAIINGSEREKRIENQRNLIVATVAAMGNESIIKRLAKMQKEIEKSQLLLDKSDNLLEEMTRVLDRLQEEADQHQLDNETNKVEPPLPVPGETLEMERNNCEQPSEDSTQYRQQVYSAVFERNISEVQMNSNDGIKGDTKKQKLSDDLSGVPIVTKPPADYNNNCLDQLPVGDCLELLHAGQTVLATLTPSVLSPWQPATVISINSASCRVQVLSLPDPVFLPLAQIAGNFPPGNVLPVGTRCVALYAEGSDDEGFYPGVVGEQPTDENDGRYLVFYDDGFPSYIDAVNLRQVCKSIRKVWQEVDPGNKQFIERYLTEYPSRKMVKLKVGDKISIELCGSWILGEVTEVDVSLAYIMFDDHDICEWMYRGSKRLLPIYKLLQMKDGLKVPTLGHLVQQKVPTLDYLPYELHKCSPHCVAQYPHQPSLHRSNSPLTIPLHLGWRREVATHKDSEVIGNWSVFYITPCGVRLRNMEEVHTMLTIYNSSLSVDLFVFDCWVNVLNEFKATKDLLEMADVSHGSERMAIPACNPYSSTPPPFMEYSTAPQLQQGVKDVSDTDAGFLVGCDCTNDCQDKERCACRQLTIQATACDWDGMVNTHAGYNYRRLPDVVLTGIYECNQTCACMTTCLNRVVQLSLRARLQVFKTQSKGWGIRTLVDLPQGSFVCTYVGKVHVSEEEAGFEDAYFADMDMIEVVERRKEGYESDVSEDEMEEDETIEENKLVMDVYAKNIASEVNVKPKFRGTRQLYGPGQEVFIMDAMTQGNIGRYFNHSCSPNTFVQNVFVSQHDLRFPSMAFFTMKFVPAGTELCWDYSYKVGALPGKQIDCHCGADNCRKRLL